MDGTDCIIQDPFSCSTEWYSHTFHGPGLRYDVAASISEGHILWVNGTYPCGSYPAEKTFIIGLINKLLPFDYVLCDGGYSEMDYIHAIDDESHLGQTLLARHETVNRLKKTLNVLSHRFRNKKSLHSFCFHAFLNIVQLLLQDSDPRFSVNFIYKLWFVANDCNEFEIF